MARSRLPPVGTTYTFTVETDDGRPTLITFDLRAAKPPLRPGQKPRLGEVVVTTIFRVAAPPPAPGNLDATLASETFTISWDAVSGADRYRVQHRSDPQSAWTDLPDATPTDTRATWTPTALTCGETYTFQVEAHGDGSAYNAEWGTAATAAVSTTACDQRPVFGSSTYAFSIAESAVVGAAVGDVAASPAAGVSYTITAGNAAGTFAIGAAGGQITVEGALDYAATPSYTLTVRASDRRGGAATATVVIAVVKPPPAPQNLSATLADETFTIRWDAVTGADRYRVQYRSDPLSAWTDLPDGTPTDTRATWTPAALACGETYTFQVEAHGDASAYSADWGAATTSAAVLTTACDQRPVFGSSRYTFFIAESAVVGATVGDVAASPAAGVSYTITAGNAAGTFAIGAASGQITVAEALDHATAPSYTLTVRASDGRGGAATAAVDIAVIVPPPAPQNLSATATADAVTLTWDAPDDASVSGYQILRRRPPRGRVRCWCTSRIPAARPPPSPTPT